MKKVLICALGIALVSMCGSASAAKVWDDLSWWAQSEATPGPVKDAARSGYWWWPKEPASNAGDAELWGNRGVVYGMYEEKEEVKLTPPPPPPPPPPPTRTKPVFSHVLFDFDKSDIRPDAEPILGAVIREMKEYRNDKLLIEGHTCNVGTDEYNMGLGQRRSDSVKKYLVDHGIAEYRVTTKSFGESQPAVSNETPESRKKNRRVVFVITMGG